MSSLSGYSGMRGPTGGMTPSRNTGNVIPKGYRAAQLQQFTPEQMNLFRQLFSQVSPDSDLSRLAGGDQSAFEQLEAPALRQFAGIQGNLASRFSGMGTGGRHSSGFQNTANSAASNFAQELQSNRLGLQRQAMQDLMGMSSQLLNQRPYEQFLVQKQQRPSFLQSLLGGAAPAAGAIIGGSYGGLPGAKLGGSLGSAFGSAFNPMSMSGWG
jgi:hypothetical protein